MSGTVVSQWIADLGIWPLIVMLLPNLMLFRKHGPVAKRKRLASLFQAIAVFLVTIVAGTVVNIGLTDIHLVLGVAAVAVGAYLLRKRMFPYRLTCPACGRKHEIFTGEFKNVYVMDDDLCDACRDASRAEETADDSQ